MPSSVGKHLALLLLGLVAAFAARADDGLLFREEFQNLDRWEPLYFDKIERHSRYEIRRLGEADVLAATSDDSASALVLKRRYSVRDYPVLKWRWRVDQVYAGGDYRRKAGDDYPLRIYVMFAYDPERATLGTRLQYGLAKAIYGRYPPLNSLNYIWANREDATQWAASPYTERAMLIPLERGARKLGRWVEETVDVLADYRKAFGGEPPAEASLAVMSDGDNTGEGTTAFIDFIEVRR